MSIANHITKENIERMFGNPEEERLGAIVTYEEGNELRQYCGIFYEVTDEVLVVGGYLKSVHFARPRDFDEKTKRIPLNTVIEVYPGKFNSV